MREPARATPTVPYGADQTIYLVVDGFGKKDPFVQTSDAERTDIEAVICDLMSGQFNDPLRVVAFNTLEHWSSDISIDIAREIQSRCDSDGCEIPQYLAGFMEMHIARSHHLTRQRT